MTVLLTWFITSVKNLKISFRSQDTLHSSALATGDITVGYTYIIMMSIIHDPGLFAAHYSFVITPRDWQRVSQKHQSSIGVCKVAGDVIQYTCS